MGKAQIKATKNEIKNTVQSWATSKSIPISKTPHYLKAQNRLCQIIWQIQETPEGQIVDVSIHPRTHVSIILDMCLFLGLIGMIGELQASCEAFNFADMIGFVTLAVISLFLMWLRMNYLWLKLTQIENSFWQDIHNAFDTEMLSRPQAKLYSHSHRLVRELMMTMVAGYIVGYLAGHIAFIAVIIICLLVLLMGTMDDLTASNYQHNWRFWYMRNQSKWTWYMLGTCGMPVVLLCFEFLLSMSNNNNENIIEILRRSEIRSVLPKTAEELEKDAESKLEDIVIHGVTQRNPSISGLDKAKKEIILLYLECLSYLMLIVVAVSYLLIRPLRNILRSHNIWQHEMVWSHTNTDQSPHVPSQSNTWKWKSQSKFRAVAYLYLIIGGFIHISANVFCFESLCYAFLSHCLILKSVANLWSWVFVMCKVVFGQNVGQVYAVVLVFVISLPILILAAIFLRRMWGMLRFIAKSLSEKDFNLNNCLLPHTVQQSIRSICKQHSIKEPLILINQSQKRVSLKLWYFILIDYSVIEIDRVLLNYLTDEELKAAIAHELGHLHSGQIKIALMKWLSSLALFPNYYLAICINWAQLEMEADQFAIGATRNPSALQQALVKMSAAEISYTSNSNKSDSLFIQKYRGIRTAMRYYFGDSLLGYAHPTLSERLAVIDQFGT